VILARLARGLVVVAFAGAGGCVDLSPVDFEAPDGGVPEAAKGAVTDGPSSEALVDACHTCLSMGPCVPSWTACVANSSCAKLAACMTTSLCWAANLSNLADLSPCVVTCAETAGITSQNAPAAVLATPLFTCAQDPARCGAVCVGSAQDP
jgi:hypothetical protein